MVLCKDCKHFKPTDDERGTCFGIEVFANGEADKCLIQAFGPRHGPESAFSNPSGFSIAVVLPARVDPNMPNVSPS